MSAGARLLRWAPGPAGATCPERQFPLASPAAPRRQQAGEQQDRRARRRLAGDVAALLGRPRLAADLGWPLVGPEVGLAARPRRARTILVDDRRQRVAVIRPAAAVAAAAAAGRAAAGGRAAAAGPVALVKIGRASGRDGGEV